MSAIKQILLSLVVIVIAAGAWYAYDHGYFSAANDPVSAASRPGGGPAGGGPPGGGRPSGGGGPPSGGFAGGGGFGRAATPVVAAAVETDNNSLEVHAIGTVAAARAVTLYPQVSGVVTEVAFKPGTKVAAGEVLVRLDDSDQQVAVDKAKIALDGVKSTLERSQQLAKSNNITSVALNDAQTAVQKAEIDLKSAELELAKRTVKAPFAGTIGLTDITVGDLVNSSKAIATLDDMSTVTTAFNVPERASGRVAGASRGRSAPSTAASTRSPARSGSRRRCPTTPTFSSPAWRWRSTCRSPARTIPPCPRWRCNGTATGRTCGRSTAIPSTASTSTSSTGAPVSSSSSAICNRAIR
jgi:multidrug efflux pump subunit AcrA (membrane-fusion protein)